MRTLLLVAHGVRMFFSERHIFVHHKRPRLYPPSVIRAAELGDDIGMLVDHVNVLVRIIGNVIQFRVVY